MASAALMKELEAALDKAQAEHLVDSLFQDSGPAPTLQDALDRRLYLASAGPRKKSRLDLALDLLEMGANPNAPQAPAGGWRLASKTENAFIAATAAHDLPMVDLLGRHAQPNSAPPGGMLPLITASSRGSEKMVEALLKAGADPGAVDEFGSTALMEASFRGEARICALLAARSDCDARARDGDGCLALALRSDHAWGCAQAILPHANPKARHGERKTALMIALERAVAPAVEWLLPRSDLGARDKHGKGPADYAQGQGKVLLDAWMERLAQARDLDQAALPAPPAKRPRI
jgi:hypothetical protein